VGTRKDRHCCGAPLIDGEQLAKELLIVESTGYTSGAILTVALYWNLK